MYLKGPLHIQLCTEAYFQLLGLQSSTYYKTLLLDMLDNNF